jgi:outer membrane receptor protein involved in Fe transport
MTGFVSFPSAISFRSTIYVVAFLVFLSTGPVGLSQSSKGTVAGTVTDPSGAAVPRAVVVLKQQETSAERDTTTNDAGIYRFDAVNLGTYNLRIKAPGFREARVDGLTVAANQVANFDLQLELGSTAETVIVEAGAVALQTSEAVRGGNFETQQIIQLPLAAQDSINVLLLIPGVQNASTTQFSDGSNNYSVNGERARSNNFMIDGVENNDISVGGAAFQIHNNDAIQEVSVQTSNFSAEFGRAGGVVLNQITKSGGNAVHGTLAEVYLSHVFDATNNSERLGGQKSPSKFNENVPAFTLGGPVYIPHLYDGRDKTFFFVAGQWDRFYSTASKTLTAVPLAGPTGIGVLQALASACPNVALYLKALGGLTGNGISTQTIPISVQSGSTCDGTLRTGQSVVVSNGLRSSSQSNLDANHLVRIDEIVSKKQTMSFRWLYDSNTAAPFFNNLPGFDRGFTGKTMTGLFTDTYVFSPRWTNEFRFNYGRIGFNFPGLGPDSFHSTLPNFAIAGITGFGLATNIPQFRYANNWQYQDTVSAVFGRHTIRFGVDFLRQLAKQHPPFNERGSFSYRSSGAGATAVTALANFIDDFGGKSGNTQRQFGVSIYYPNLFRQSYFVQDNFRVTSTFTLNLGLRYEYFGQPANRFKIPAFTNYDPVNFAQPNKVNPDKNNFGPVVGFAWAPHYSSGLLGKLSGNGKLVWRGGFQISYDTWFNNLLSNIAGSSPNTLGGLITSPSTGRGTPNFQSQFASITATPPTAQSPQSSLFDPNIRNPYTERWSFGLQRELGWGTLVDLSYVGSEGHKLFQTLDMNPIVNAASGARFVTAVGSRSMRCSCANSNYHSLQLNVRRRYSTTPVGSLLLEGAYTYSHYIDQVSEVFATDSTASSFQSLPQVLGFSPSVDRGDSDNDRRHRIVIDAVWSLRGPKAGILGQVLGGWSLAPVTQFVTGAPFTLQAGVDRNGDGQTAPDRPDIGNPNAQLNTRGLLVSTIAPATKPVMCGNWSPTGLVNPDAGTCVTTSDVHWVSGAILGAPGARTVGRNTLRTPFVWQQDLDVIKTFRITERMHLEYRAEIFNLFNRENFGLVFPTTPTAASFGDVLNTPAPATLGSHPLFLDFGQTEAVGRNMRMGLKLSW